MHIVSPPPLRRMPCGDLRWQWMRIALVTPAGPGMRNGNRHTALRWAMFLRRAGHKVGLCVQWSPDARVEAMLALHARRSYPSIKTFSSDKLLVVALTGTDVY